MKKTLAILALALFLGGMGSSAVMASTQPAIAVSVSEDEKKSDDTTTAKKAEATKESKECSKECEKKCEGEKKESKDNQK